MDRRIIINADDFGLCSGVNRAVAQAHTEGVLTSATIMANMPAAAEAVEIAKKLPTFGVGVHLNLTEGQPLSQGSELGALLDADGKFAHSLLKLAFFPLAAPKLRSAMRDELAAQIQWIIDKGLKPTHLDSHKHFHTFPPIFSLVCQLARRFGIPAIRFAFEPKEVSAMPWPLPSIGGKKRAKKVRTMAMINRLQNPAFFKTNALLGVAHTGKIDVNFFRAAALYTSAATAEVMTHPGFVDGPEARENGSLNQRKGELAALCSEKTKRHFKDAGTKLVHYGQL